MQRDMHLYLQPIMALSDVDISPGFVTQLSVTPTLIKTTQVRLLNNMPLVTRRAL